MRLTIYFKDGSYVDDCLIDSINYYPESNMIEFSDRFEHKQVRDFKKIACMVVKGEASYEN